MVIIKQTTLIKKKKRQLNEIVDVDSATGNSKKKAKHAASEALLEQLLSEEGGYKERFVLDGVAVNAEKLNEVISDGVEAPSVGESSAENPIGQLQEICMKRRWQLPHYESEKDVLPNGPYSIMCFVESFTTLGEGKKKRLAKRQAAENMLNRLKDLKIISEDEEEAVKHEKVKIAKPVLHEENNAEENMAVSDVEKGVQKFKKVKAESKELDLDVKEDSDEMDDSDEELLKEKLASIEQKAENIRAKLKEKAERSEKSKITHEKSSKHIGESFEEKEARSLLIKNLPNDVTKEDLEKLSSDIVEVKRKKRFAFIRFNDEETAVSNLNVLKSKTIKGQSIFVDICGSKKNSRKLFVTKLPRDITEDDFKKLSEDIIEIFISPSSGFAILEFDSQEKAESNYEIIKDQVIRGHQIFVDKYISRDRDAVKGGMKQISVAGLPIDVTLQQVASYFKKAFEISLHRSDSCRTATISFDTEEDAREAYNATKDAEISEHKLTLELCKSSEEMPEIGGGSFGGRGQFRGRPFRGRGQFGGGRPFRGRGQFGAGRPFRGRGQFRGGRPFRGGRNNW